MVAYLEERWSHAALWCRRLALFALALAAVALCVHWAQLIDTLPFLWTLGVVLALIVLALVLAAAGFQRVWDIGDRGAVALAVGTLASALVLAPLAVLVFLAYSHPALTDVSTDLDDPPRLQAALAFRGPEMNAIQPPTAGSKAVQQKAYPEITGRRYAAPTDQITTAIENMMTARGWQVLSMLPTGSETEYTVEALARLPILALPYDVAIRVTDEGTATYVDMRSSARYGWRDFGSNAKLISGFLTELDTQAAALAGATAPAEQ